MAPDDTEHTCTLCSRQTELVRLEETCMKEKEYSKETHKEFTGLGSACESQLRPSPPPRSRPRHAEGYANGSPARHDKD